MLAIYQLPRRGCAALAKAVKEVSSCGFLRYRLIYLNQNWKSLTLRLPFSTGIITSSLGLVNFGKSEFPFANDNHCGVRIAVGLDAAVNPHTLGGNWPDIRFFNENGEAIGQQYDLKKEEDDLMDSPVKLKGGESYDSVIKLDHAQQPTYGLFNGNKDAICIGYISVTWPDTQEFAWLGSWGKQCGQPWYYSGLFFEEADPVCTWLDEDGTATDVMGFQVHFPEFKADSNGKYKKDID